MTKRSEFDVHFSINGFYCAVDATDKEEAAATAERWLERARSCIEAELGAGVSIEIADVLEIGKDI